MQERRAIFPPYIYLQYVVVQDTWGRILLEHLATCGGALSPDNTLHIRSLAVRTWLCVVRTPRQKQYTHESFLVLKPLHARDHFC